MRITFPDLTKNDPNAGWRVERAEFQQPVAEDLHALSGLFAQGRYSETAALAQTMTVTVNGQNN